MGGQVAERDREANSLLSLEPELGLDLKTPKMMT